MYNQINVKNIEDEETAFAFLVQTDSSKFKKFIAINEDTIEDDPEFYIEYRNSLDDQYETLELDSFIFQMFKASQALKLWSGNFERYVSDLYNNGFIFSQNVYEHLSNKYTITVSNERFGWAYEFYKDWIEPVSYTHLTLPTKA